MRAHTRTRTLARAETRTCGIDDGVDVVRRAVLRLDAALRETRDA